MVTGTFLLNNQFASILFDTGADTSFVSIDFEPRINLRPQKLDEVYIIEYANGQKFRADDVINDCTLKLADTDFNIDLILI